MIYLFLVFIVCFSLRLSRRLCSLFTITALTNFLSLTAYVCPYGVVSISPKEVADFCLPLGGQLSTSAAVTRSRDGTPGLSGSAFGRHVTVCHSSRLYSANCFVFVLDDKTVAQRAQGAEGVSEGAPQCPGQRLYGICVQQVRQLSVPVEHTGDSAESDARSGTEVCTDDEGEEDLPLPSPSHQSHSRSSEMVFDSKVCFAFVTRFPLIHFFFQIIHQLLEADETNRKMGGRRGKGKGKRKGYSHQYIPTALLDGVLSRLMRLPPPRYGTLRHMTRRAVESM